MGQIYVSSMESRDSFMPSKGGSCSLYSMVIKEYSFKARSLFLMIKFLTVEQKTVI